MQARDGEEALERYRAESVEPRRPRPHASPPRRSRGVPPAAGGAQRGSHHHAHRSGRRGGQGLGLELGADDYITKPFSIREFMSRVPRSSGGRSCRRPGRAPRYSSWTGSGSTSPGAPSRRGARRSFHVPRVRAPPHAGGEPRPRFPRKALLDELWGGSEYRDPRTIDVHVRHLREKLERDPSEPELIFTVRGAGYRFRDVR